MCVHFRYGCQISSLEAFPGSGLGILPYLPQRSVRITSSPFQYPDLPGYQLPRLPRLFHPPVLPACSVTPFTPSDQYRNLHLLSIDYASRPRLRPRLTQSGRTFLWKPWVFGAWDSHPRAATHAGILSSSRSTCPYSHASPLTGMLPYHTFRIHSFGIMLSPGKFSAQNHSASELLRTL